MKKSIVPIIFVMMCVHSLHAQKSKFGKVTVEELSESAHHLEPEAKAAILYQEGKHKLEYNKSKEQFVLITEVYKKIKIYDASDDSYSNVNLSLYKTNKSEEKAQSIKAVTYNLEGSKINESKLNKKSVFKEKVSKNYNKTKFALPNVKDGSIVEYKYKIISPFIFQVDKWYFQHHIPCNETFYEIEYPEHYRYKPTSSGWLPLNIENSSQQRNITFSFTKDVSTNPNVVQNKWFTEKVDYKGVIKTIKQYDTPSIKEESYITSLNAYRSAISYELEAISWPGQTFKQYTQTWNQIATVLDESKGFGKPLRQNFKEMKPLIEQAKGKSNVEALAEVYNHIRSTYNYNGNIGIDTDEGIKNLIKTGEGNAAEINLLLVNTLNKAGVEAYPIITKTRNSGPLNTSYPILSDLNYVFAAAIIDDKTYYLDATDKSILPGELPLRAINMQGVLINGVKGIELNISNPNKSATTKMIEASVDDDQNLVCTTKQKFAGVSANAYRQKYSNVNSNDDWMDKLEAADENMEYESIEVTNGKKGSISTSEQYSLEGCSEVINDKIYVDVLLGNGLKENPFTSKERNYPVFYPYRINNNVVITLNIPEGYQIESMPEKTIVSLPNKMGMFSFTPTPHETKVQLHYSFKISQPTIGPNDYLALKKFYELAVAKAKEKIVLSKKV